MPLVYVRHRLGHSLGKKSDEHLQCSPQSWLDNFMQPFSWRSSLVRALDFLNKSFLPGVYVWNTFESIQNLILFSFLKKLISKVRVWFCHHQRLLSKSTRRIPMKFGKLASSLYCIQMTLKKKKNCLNKTWKWPKNF